MGLLDQLTQSLVRSMGPSGGGPLVQPILNLLKGDGLNNLIKSFQTKGLGDLMASWIGTGQNEPISKEQVRHALGDEHVASMAHQMGVSEDDALGHLTEVMPTAIDRLTPDGKLPDAAELEKHLGVS